jgi:molybdopterin synthase catalytic subunit
MVVLEESPIEPFRLLAQLEARLALTPGSFGATSIFIGTMRDFNEGDSVTALFLEHYPGMTESKIGDILDQAKSQWDILEASVVHRIGQVLPNETLVVVAVWSAHRSAAYAANRFILEELKHHAPFWKKESLKSGTRWVEKNTTA